MPIFRPIGRMFFIGALLIGGLAAAASARFIAQQPAVPAVNFPTGRVLTHREQDPLVKRWIADRFDAVLPGLMRREGIDMWIIVSREYNDDLVFGRWRR